ncbi:synaptonemal complex protein 2-like isoform X2 [Xenopus laevis]|uniref:Synaptonemal complex protein 2-like isoform X2 n=1 Tax=Xenopus laevis TaxID=8355 RepID=A0A8J1LZE0_XENLA|nr:synaptonemal complex protein 2-like isoform X2 [Xenopus laevis]
MMPPTHESQLEVNIDHALRTRGPDLRPLKAFLLSESCAGASQKCSKFLLGKLDKLICRELDNREVKEASLVLNVIHKFASCMTLNNEEWLTASVKQGLVEKMIIWFEKSTDLFAYGEKQKNETMINFAEDFFDVVMLIHDHSSEGKMQILEHFLVRVCSLISNTAINIFIKQEAARKLNLMLDTMPVGARNTILVTEEITSAMTSMARRILDIGDYDLQVAITEALCRMASATQRGELATLWFPMEFVSEAFKGIKDSEFETDCRKFLNLINGILGNKQSVVTMPCLSAYLNNHKLQIPCDEKLEEFWIDFNTGTQSISFYVSTDTAEDHQWDTVCMTDSDVIVYSIEEVDNNKLLTVDLKAPIAIGQYEGKQIRIYFSSPLDILDATRRVFAAHKDKGFIKKQTVSEAETTVRIIFEDSGSQVLLSESQGSISSIKPVTETDVRDIAGKNQPSSATQSLHQTTCSNEHDFNTSKFATPLKSKVSEVSMVVPASTELKTNKAANNACRKLRIKPPLEMVRSTERNTLPLYETRGGSPCSNRTHKLPKHRSSAENTDAAYTSEDINKLLKDESNEIVPDTQFCATKDPPLLFGVTKRSVNQQERNKKQENWRGLRDRVSISSGYIANQEKISSLHVKQQLVSVGEQSLKQTGKQNKTEMQHVQAHTDKNKKKGLASVSKLPPSKGLTRAKCRNDTEKDFVSKPDTNLKMESTRANEISATQAKETSAKKCNQPSGRKGMIYQRSSESGIVKCCDKRMKEKPKEMTDTANLFIKNIRRKYTGETEENKREETVFERKNSNKHSLHTNKDQNRTRGFNLNSTKDFQTKTKELWNDVYNFQISAIDNPTINLGISSATLSEKMSNKALASCLKSSKDKQKGMANTEKKAKDHRKHLFSDSDTERGADETKTDVSWLQEPQSKKKHNISYKRQKAQKKQDQAMPNKMMPITKNSSSEPNIGKKSYNTSEGNKSDKLKRPRRATIKSTNYKDLSNSESETEVPVPSLKREEPVSGKFEIYKAQKDLVKKMKNFEKNNLKNAQKKCLENETQKHSKVTTRNQQEPTYSPPASPAPSVEQLRSKEYDSDPQLSPVHQTFVRRSSPSLSVSSSLKATPEKSKDIKGTTFCTTEIKYMHHQWTESSNKSGTRTRKCDSSTSGKGTTSSIYSLVSKPTPSHFTLDQSLVNTNIEISATEDSRQPGPGTRILSTEVHSTSTKVSVKSLKRNHNDFSIHDDINPECDEHENTGFRGKHKKRKLLPRKLFQSPDKGISTCRGSETLSTLSGNEASNTGLDNWEESGAEVGLICQQISREFTRKVQNRSRKMDSFTKQSLKSVQHHVTSLGVQVRDFRIKGLDQFQQTIIEEIEKFEKDSQALKNMEKDFTAFWKNQMQALSVYHQNEQKRIHQLRSLFENNTFQNVEYEEDIFNSEMHLMKDDMKQFQERLLKEMQEEELHSVRRGLQSLFMAGARNL